MAWWHGDRSVGRTQGPEGEELGFRDTGGAARGHDPRAADRRRGEGGVAGKWSGSPGARGGAAGGNRQRGEVPEKLVLPPAELLLEVTYPSLLPLCSAPPSAPFSLLLGTNALFLVGTTLASLSFLFRTTMDTPLSLGEERRRLSVKRVVTIPVRISWPQEMFAPNLRLENATDIIAMVRKSFGLVSGAGTEYGEL